MSISIKSIDSTDSKIALNAESSKIHSSLSQELTKLKSINDEYHKCIGTLTLKNNISWDKLSILSSKWIQVLSLFASNVYTLSDLTENKIESMEPIEPFQLNIFENSEECIAMINSELNILNLRIQCLFLKKISIYKELENNSFVPFSSDENQISDKFIHARKNCFEKIYKGLIQYKLLSYDPHFDDAKLNATLASINPSEISKSWSLFSFYSTSILTGFEDCPSNVFHELILDYKKSSLEVDSTYDQYVKISKELTNQKIVIEELEKKSKELMDKLRII